MDMRRLLKLTFIVILVLGMPLPKLYAQDVQLTATVDSRTAVLGSVVQLTLTLEGAQGSVAPQLPDINGFEARYIGPSTRVSIINGQYSSSVSYIYNLLPLKEGKWIIPSITMNIKGQTLQTDPIEVEVVSQGTPVQKQEEQRPDMSASGIEDKMFLTLEMPKKEAYIYEKIPATIKLYVADLSIRDIQYPKLEKTGFTMDDLKEPRQYVQNIGGVHYDVVEFDSYIYPTRKGELTIGPAQLNCSILYRKSQKRRSVFGDFDSFFDNDLFDSFFDSYQRYPYTVQSTDLTIRVLPLPQENRPQDFSQAVGRFDFEVSVSPREVTEGDPVTLRMKISGEGNLNNISMPALADSEQIKTYEPTIKQEDGTKILEQVVIPKSYAIKELPAISFSYFDSDQGQYKTITRGPFPLQVNKSSVGQLKVVSSPQKEQTVSPEVLGRDIVFIKEDPGILAKTGTNFYSSIKFYAVFVIITLFFGIANITIWHNQKLKSDVHYARSLRAPKRARAGLKEARKHLGQNQVSSFYDTIFRTLQEYLSRKFRLPPGAVTVKAVEEKLHNKRFDKDMLGRLKGIFDTCDTIRYASLTREKEQMEEDLKTTEKIIDHFERVG